MEQLSSHGQEEGDINPLPINSYGGGGEEGSGHGHDHDHDHMLHHHHSGLAPQIPSNNAPLMLLQQDHHVLLPHNKSDSKKKDDGNLVIIRYMECLKNHAASLGGSATDGCGEFIPSGEQGTLEALHCSACNCHRNFHRKQIQGQPQPPTSSSAFFTHSPHFTNSSGELRKLILGHHHHQPKNVFKETDSTTPFSLRYPTKASASASASAHHKIMLSYNNYISESGHEHHQQELDVDGVMMMMPHHQHHHHQHDHNHSQLVKKRFRTKFTQDQKQKMLSFAEQIGWRLNKQEDDVVQQFCQEIGVKRRVLKVWMHNNKHNLAKKNNPSSSAT